MRHLVLPILLLIAGAALWIHGPIPQDQSYHDFVDQRRFMGIPNFMDVASNLPFLFIGLWGLIVTRVVRPITMRRICSTLFFGFILLTFGSGWYHWEPNDFTLVFDRIPIAVIFMAFFSIFIHDHIGEWYGSRAFPLLVFVGMASVIWWHMSGDLRPYVLVQFFPLVAIPIILVLYRGRFNYWPMVLPIYVFFTVAKLTETYDVEIFEAFGGWIGGHLLKHLFMALAGAFIVLMIRSRHEKFEAARPAVLR